MNEQILVVDDEKAVCETLREALDYEGYRVTTTGSGDDAIKLIKETSFDMVVVDPRLETATSGLEVIKSVKEMVHKPIILIISAIPRSSLEPVLREQAISHLTEKILEKPQDLNPDNFVAIVKSILRKPRE